MREALFIKRNRDKWIRYQQEQTTDPDEQAERFITLLDDLAYSRTFYPQSKVTRWINSIAVGIYQNIYQNKKEKFTRLITFWSPNFRCSFAGTTVCFYLRLFFLCCVYSWLSFLLLKTTFL